MTTNYEAPSTEKELNIINAYDLATEAEKIIPHGGWDYIRGAAGDEITLRRNTDAFEDLEIYPRVLADLENPDLSTSILGIDLPFPIIMAPAAAHGLAHVTAEKGTARGVAEVGTIMGVSTYSNDTIDDIAKAGNGGPQWFQLYMSKDEEFNKAIVKHAEENGAKALIITADATVGGNREADVRNNFKMPLPMANLEKFSAGQGLTIAQIFANALQTISIDSIKKVASYTHLPIIVKGIQSAEDAMIAIGAGAAAVWVSNHGGRQLDGGPASIEVLEEIAVAVDKKVPVIFDSGIRRGQHIFKALASGADIVAIGRPALYGLALGGWMGVKSVFEHFSKELKMVMQLAGTKNIEAVKKTILR